MIPLRLDAYRFKTRMRQDQTDQFGQTHDFQPRLQNAKETRYRNNPPQRKRCCRRWEAQRSNKRGRKQQTLLRRVIAPTARPNAMISSTKVVVMTIHDGPLIVASPNSTMGTGSSAKNSQQDTPQLIPCSQGQGQSINVKIVSSRERVAPPPPAPDTTTRTSKSRPAQSNFSHIIMGLHGCSSSIVRLPAQCLDGSELAPSAATESERN